MEASDQPHRITACATGQLMLRSGLFTVEYRLRWGKGHPAERAARRFRRKESMVLQEPIHRILDGKEMGRLADDHIQRRTIGGRIARTHYNRGNRRTEFENVSHLSTGHSRHGIIRQNQVMQRGIEPLQRLGRPLSRIHFITKVVEKHLGQEPRVNIIVNQQHGSYPGL
jgi:hypothetical protein